LPLRFNGLLFDMGDVFYDASGWRHWLTVELNDRGVPCSYEELVGRWENLLVDVYCGRAEYWERFTMLLDSLGVPATVARALASTARLQARVVQQDRQLFDGVAPTLEKLHDMGLRLGVLTDTESTGDRIRATLDSFGIERYFDAIVSSRDIGHAKPERAAYEAAVKALGIATAGCAFVGHDVAELDGATSAGLHTIAYNHPHGAIADFHLKDFTDLISIVSSDRITAA
jgi:HAD superfamily hydrolase (TIGR01509 family)